MGSFQRRIRHSDVAAALPLPRLPVRRSSTHTKKKKNLLALLSPSAHLFPLLPHTHTHTRAYKTRVPRLLRHCLIVAKEEGRGGRRSGLIQHSGTPRCHFSLSVLQSCRCVCGERERGEDPHATLLIRLPSHLPSFFPVPCFLPCFVSTLSLSSAHHAFIAGGSPDRSGRPVDHHRSRYAARCRGLVGCQGSARTSL
jgi:hypothetical protein